MLSDYSIGGTHNAKSLLTGAMAAQITSKKTTPEALAKSFKADTAGYIVSKSAESSPEDASDTIEMLLLQSARHLQRLGGLTCDIPPGLFGQCIG